jgi:hypothetical protein
MLRERRRAVRRTLAEGRQTGSDRADGAGEKQRDSEVPQRNPVAPAGLVQDLYSLSPGDKRKRPCSGTATARNGGTARRILLTQVALY